MSDLSNESLAPEAGGSGKDSNQFGNRRKNLKLRNLGSSVKFALISQVLAFVIFKSEMEVSEEPHLTIVWSPRLKVQTKFQTSLAIADEISNSELWVAVVSFMNFIISKRKRKSSERLV